MILTVYSLTFESVNTKKTCKMGERHVYSGIKELNMWSGIDKRRFPRARYECKIHIRRKDSLKTITTATENIGGGGICVVLDEDLGLFHGVDLEITLDDGNSPVSCAGTVVWVVKKRRSQMDPVSLFDTGIEFVDISDNDVQRIINIVEAILQKEKPLP